MTPSGVEQDVPAGASSMDSQPVTDSSPAKPKTAEAEQHESEESTITAETHAEHDVCEGEAPAAVLRNRRAPSAVPDRGAAPQGGGAGGAEPELEPRRAALLGVLRVAAREVLYVGVIVLLAIWAASRFIESTSPENVLFAPERLAKVDGVHSRKIYLAILGQMFDVTKGRQHYGKFETDLTDDLSDLTPENLAALLDWRTFYTEHKVYKHMGRVIGRFYTEAGERTPELDRVEALAAEAAASSPPKAKRTAYTACNMQWSVKKGKEVWCSPGKGFPRRVQADATERCECSERPIYNAQMALYDGCAADASRCALPESR